MRLIALSMTASRSSRSNPCSSPITIGPFFPHCWNVRGAKPLGSGPNIRRSSRRMNSRRVDIAGVTVSMDGQSLDTSISTKAIETRKSCSCKGRSISAKWSSAFRA